jgi:unsaturated rhamnogalacturonyl hydrolase
VVVLDNYYNNEWKKDATGTMVPYHYTWNDKTNSGFAMLGDIFRMHGVTTRSLIDAPSASSLKGANMYIIVDPDTEKETEKPNYIEKAQAQAIAAWVKDGGVLVLMGNDAGNAEFKQFNGLANLFGVQFNEDNFNQVKDNQFEQGTVSVSANNPVFKTAKKLYIKELATLKLSKPATPVLNKEGRVVAAMAKYGKGTVFAIGDPWLYNEYVDGRKLPAEFNNYQAATDLVNWLIKQTPSNKLL